MENDEQNLMDFNSTAHNISPNSKFMKPLIRPIISTRTKSRTLPIASRLSVDNNPFDKVLREIHLKNIDDDPFEKALQASLSISSDKDIESKNAELCSKSDKIKSAPDEQNKSNMFFENELPIIVLNGEENLPENNQKSIVDSQTELNSSFLVNFVYPYEKCTPPSVNNSSLREVDTSDKLYNDCSLEQNSDLNRAFVDENQTHSISLGSSNISAYSKPSINKYRCKSAQVCTGDMLSTSSGGNLDILYDQEDLNISVFDEANQIAHNLSEICDTSYELKRANSCEDLLSIQPAWCNYAETIDKFEDCANEAKVLAKQNQDSVNDTKDVLLKAKELLSVIKIGLDNADINKKDLGQILSNVSNLQDRLRLKNLNEAPIFKQLNRQGTYIEKEPFFCVKQNIKINNEETANTELKNNSVTENDDSTFVQEKVPKFFKCLERMAGMQENNLIDELVTNLCTLLNEKLQENKENVHTVPTSSVLNNSNKCSFTQKNKLRYRRNSTDKQQAFEEKIQNISVKSMNRQRSNTVGIPRNLNSSLKSSIAIKSSIKPKPKKLNVGANPTTCYLKGSNKIGHSMKTSTPNSDDFCHSTTFTFSTPGNCGFK